MTKLSNITVETNLMEYFKDLVTGALRNQQVDTHEMAEYYLVNLLAEFHKTDRITPRCPKTGDEEPWAITYLRATHLSSKEKFSVLKGLGDRSLYLSGIFAQHLESTAAGLDYYISMGGLAYTHVAELMGLTKCELQTLFKELAEKFPAFVEILSEVSSTAGMQKDSDLIKMYERWLKTGNQRAEKLLIKAGVPLSAIRSNFIQ